MKQHRVRSLLYNIVTGLHRLRLKGNGLILLDAQRSRLMEKSLKSDPTDLVLISVIVFFVCYILTIVNSTVSFELKVKHFMVHLVRASFTFF